MGTRSLTKVIEQQKESGKEYIIAMMYRQYDGYIDGHGKDLADFLENCEVVNGIRDVKEGGRTFNGPGCLAAQCVAHFKDDGEPGGIYLQGPDPEAGEEYTYEIVVKMNGVSPDPQPIIRVSGGDHYYDEYTLEEFIELTHKESEPVRSNLMNYWKMRNK